MSTFSETSIRTMRSVSSGNFMDGRHPQHTGIQVYLSEPRASNNNVFEWVFTKLSDGTFNIKSVSSGLYLDGRHEGIGNGIHVQLLNRTPNEASTSDYFKWNVQEFTYEGLTRYAIQSVSSGLYLDGRNPEHTGIQLFLTGRNPQGDRYLMWDLSEHEDPAADICDPTLTDDERLKLWLSLYYLKWNHFPIKQLDDALDEATINFFDELTKIAQTDYVSEGLDLQHFGLAVGIITADDGLDVAEVLITAGLEQGFNASVNVAIRTAVARGIIESAVRGAGTGAAVAGTGAAVAVTGAVAGTGAVAARPVLRRGAAIALGRAASVAGGSAAANAFTALTNPAIGLGAVVGDIAATAVLGAFGIDDPTVGMVVGGSAGILSAAFAGGMVAGPIGAGVGATLGAGTFIIGQGVEGIFNAFRGGQSDNWCYIEIQDLRRDNKQFCASSYKGSDGFYLASYQDKYYSSNSKDYFSAGNEQDEYFQVSLYDEWGNNIKTYQRVSYCDTFFVNRHPSNGSLIIVYARGGFNVENPGSVDFYEHS